MQIMLLFGGLLMMLEGGQGLHRVGGLRDGECSNNTRRGMSMHSYILLLC